MRTIEVVRPGRYSDKVFAWLQRCEVGQFYLRSSEDTGRREYAQGGVVCHVVVEIFSDFESMHLSNLLGHFTQESEIKLCG